MEFVIITKYCGLRWALCTDGQFRTPKHEDVRTFETRASAEAQRAQLGRFETPLIVLNVNEVI